jgi:hypothetical protein
MNKPEKAKDEKSRIIQKIKERKVFQSESWDNLTFILKILEKNGFFRPGDMATEPTNQKGVRFYLVKDKREKASILLNEFMGKYIQVEFTSLGDNSKN